MTPATPNLAARLLALEAQATPGPWEQDDTGEANAVLNGPDSIIAEFDVDAPPVEHTWEPNLRLTGLLRNNLPLILAALELAEDCYQCRDLSTALANYVTAKEGAK